jgi:LacI family transcriptional regulator
LNGSITLPPATVERIDAAIKALNYRPNPHARSLGRGRSDIIGLLLPDIANPFFAKLAAAVELAADSAGLGVMLCSTFNQPSREIAYVDRFRKNFMHGLLFATNHVDDGPLAAAINASSGVVLVDEDVPGTQAGRVFADNRQGGMLAGEHLLAAGHRRLAYIGGPAGLMSSRERADGFLHAVRERAGQAEVTAEMFGDYSVAHGGAAMAAILNDHPDTTAVFAGSDKILIGMLEVMRDRGVAVGSGLSVITFDDAEPLSLLDPPITAVRQPISDMGRVAIELVLRTAGETAKSEAIRLPVELIVRGSVRAPRAGRSRSHARGSTA